MNPGAAKVILLFLDGVGIGAPNPGINPLFRANLPTLTRLLGKGLFSTRQMRASTRTCELTPVSTTLGVGGLPQSGTGQTAIFTGVNAARVIGRHFGPYPTTGLRPIIDEKNIFRRLKDRGRTVVFANAFPQRFFTYTNSGTRRLTVTTLSCVMTGIRLLTADDLSKDRAVSADFVRDRWDELGHPGIRPIDPEEAGVHLANISEEHDFTLFEYWLPDHAGHKQDMDWSVLLLERFDAFLGALTEALDLRKTLVLLISDHGNIEDLSTKSHTRNPVPCIAVGAARREVAGRIKNLTHVTPSILRLL
jgi:2,3-bisphosphoglycerate-independent phosphoglycerate mutase